MKWLKRIFNFYYEGFRSMTVGKTLWKIILIKLFIMFFILKQFFFKNHLDENCASEADKADFVIEELINRN